MCDGCVLPGRKFSLDLIVMVTGDLQVKCVSAYWERTSLEGQGKQK